MTEKILTIKQIIKEDKDTDGDYWLHCGNELIYEILDTFDNYEWDELDKELIKFKDYEHSIFARAILAYNTNRKIKIDNYRIFFKEFVLLKDYEDCDCLLFDIMYIENVKNSDIELFNKVKLKVKFLEEFGYSTNNDLVKSANKSIENAIRKHYS